MNWRSRQEKVQAFWLSARHGPFCLGGCWSLMLLMSAVRVGNVGRSLTLVAMMGVEKNMPCGSKVSAPLTCSCSGRA
jgi:predicted metal-binding membrane protein